jgi:hypothetical protein
MFRRTLTEVFGFTKGWGSKVEVEHSSDTSTISGTGSSDPSAVRLTATNMDEISKAVRLTKDQAPILEIVVWFADAITHDAEMEYYTIQFISSSLEYKIEIVFPGSQKSSLVLFHELVGKIGAKRITNIITDVVVPCKEVIEKERIRAKDSTNVELHWNQRIKDCGTFTKFTVFFTSTEAPSSTTTETTRATKKRKEADA